MRNLILFLCASLSLAATKSSFASRDQQGVVSVDSESAQPVIKRKTIDAIVPSVPVVTAITHNRLVMWLRFHGVTNALHKEIDIGQLRIKNLKDAEIKLAGTRKINGETLPVVSVKYPKPGKIGGTPQAELDTMKGSVNAASGIFAVRRPKRNERKLVFFYMDPEALHLDLQDIIGAQDSGYGSEVKFSVSQATVTNPLPIVIKRSIPTVSPFPAGVLRLSSHDLDFNQIALTFEGENNKLTLSGKVKMPNALVWDYDLKDTRLIWQEGTLDIEGLSLKPAPAHTINFGGVSVGLNEVAIDKLEIAKESSSPNALPIGRLFGFKIDASTLDYKHGTLQGSLVAPIVIKQVEAEVSVKNIFEGIDLSRLNMQDMQIGLANLSYKGDNGLQLAADSLSIDVLKYKKEPTEDPEAAPETNVEATIALNGATVAGPVDARILKLNADLRGPTDKLDGQGNLVVEIQNFSRTLEFDLTKSIPTLSCIGGVKPLRLGVSQIGKVTLNADLAVFAGVPTARGSADSIAFNFNPEYWGQCEWDSKVASVNVPTVTWSDPYIACCPLDVHWDGVHFGTQPVDIDVHWVAELQPVPGVGAVLLPRIKIDKDGLKLCGGHAVMAGGFWTPQIGPNLRDCNGFWCDLPRDLLRGFYGGLEAPIGMFFGPLANALVDSVGFFDAGLLDSCTS